MLNYPKMQFSQVKLKQDSIEYLCYQMIKNNLSFDFIINMIINILLSSLLIPTFFKYSNDIFISNKKINNGMYYVIIAIGCEILSTIHKNIFIEPNKRHFIRKVHCGLEEEINKNIKYINWNKLRDLNKNELDRKKDMAKWYILGFINSIINTFINLFSFFGYTFWVGMIYPLSLLIYIVLILILMIFYPHKKKNNNDKRHELWDEYSNLQTNLYTDIIHHDGNKTLEKIKKCTDLIEMSREEDKKTDSQFTDSINIIFNIGFIINCILIINFMSSLSCSDIIIYIQYSKLMKNSVVMCINIYTTYKDAKREYNKLYDIISKLTRRIDYEQKKDFFQITIESLKYTYPNDKNDSNIPFSLVVLSDNKLNFKLGQIIKLDGNSGNGKSTFSDIINGIIPCSEYISSIYLDNSKIDGFDCITYLRYYNEQIESIGWKPSVYEIISGNYIEYDNNNIPIYIDKNDEEIVWNSLTICLCLDFLKKENITNELKWIHTRNIGMSGGQKGRISLARTIYRIMTRKPIFITLDEVDKAIQSELVVPIMQNIYKYTRENNILLFVICHNPDMKKLSEYDQVIEFVNGIAIK